MQPVGPHPDADVILVGALMWCDDPLPVLALVRDDDIANPSVAKVLAAIRTLAETGKPTGPQLILDELRRIGDLTTSVAEKFRAATTSGADGLAARHYAAAVVAESLRRRTESAGHALTTLSREASEMDLIAQSKATQQRIGECYDRLTALRGDDQ